MSRADEVVPEAAPEVLAWLDRAERLMAAGYRCGVAESCPTCWHPIGYGLICCPCETVPLYADGHRMDAHGLEALRPLFGPGATGRMPD